MNWQLTDLPDQSGRTHVVTGSTSGIGRVAALELARSGARVVLAARNEVKLAETIRAIGQEVPGALLEQLVVDVSDLDSVRRAAGVAASLGPIDVLINNAGIMGVPFATTNDGLESQLATNHFGPFLFTGLLLPQLVESGDARVVTVASSAHRTAKVAPLGDPRDHSRGYRRWETYGQTKLANLLFTYELDGRARKTGLPLKALAAHPGLAATNLMPPMKVPGSAAMINAVVQVIAQSAARGALPLLMAATDDLPGATYCGPSGLNEMRGLPTIVTATALANDREAQLKLWELSESLVGLSYP